MPDEKGRADQLREIEAAYARYEQDGRAALWDQENKGYQRLAAERDRVIDGLIESAAEGHVHACLLDVGCGTGQLAVRLRETRPEIDVVGIDLLPNRIEAARENAPWATFRVGSADRLPDPDGAFDIAAAITLFSSVPSAAMEREIAREIERVVRPEGWLIWYDIRYSNPWNAAVHGVSRARLEALFPGWTTDVRPIGVLPPLARRLGRMTRMLYPVVNAAPFMRSHLIGTLQRPG